ncbi:MAG: GMC family oxidoreductase [Janthinobacterium lividum]
MTQFDFIIVGAGSAGCALAYTLSESSRHNVLLVEAGPKDSSFFIRMPMGFAPLYGSARDWKYRPEATAAMPEPGSWIRGRTLGGSSSVNGMVYVRGQPEDYDHWASLGNPGWSWADILPVYRSMENHQLGPDECRGSGGPVDVTCTNEPNALSDAYIASAALVGMPTKEDLNRPDQVGAGYFQRTIKGGQRVSAARAFLDKCRHRKNLTVMTDTQARRLLFTGKRVTGVECLREGAIRQFAAAKEVILCGGTINSPQLLQLSGIGPASLLANLGIDLVSDLRGVGGNLQEHWNGGTVMRVGHGSLNGTMRGMGLAASMLRYVFSKSGAMAMAAAQVGGFAKTRPELKRANIQFHMAPVAVEPRNNPEDKIALTKIGGLTAFGCIMRPTPNGDVTIRSPDPEQHPRIRYEHLGTAEDRQTMLEIIRLMRRIGEQAPLQAFGAEEIFPGKHVQDEDAIIQHVLQHGGLGYHPVGTCKMGRDADAVVDARLRVHGVEGLRVADASIIPVMPSGNTNAPAMMIGLKAGQMIVEDHRIQAAA